MAKEKKEAKAPKKVVKKATKAKGKKRWVPIIGPKSFENTHLGDTHVADNERVVGKSITANLMNLTGDMRKQGIEIRFDIVKVEDGKGVAAVTGYELLPGQLKRLIRRGRSKVADSFIIRTATGRLVRIKPIVITANPASAGAQSSIRLIVREKVKQLVATMSFDKLVQELINHKLQRTLKDETGKKHPVKSVEIKACLLLPEGTSEKREVREDRRDEDFVEVKEESAEATPASGEEASKKPPAEEQAAEEQEEKPPKKEPPAEEPAEQAEETEKKE